MSLNSQQTSVRRRLSISSSGSSSPSVGSPNLSPSFSPSPSRSSTRLNPVQAPSTRHSRASSLSSSHSISSSSFSRRSSVPTILEEPPLPDPATQADQDKLFTINSRIESTLNSLMQCASVQQDARMRQWVQSRLVDAQAELSEQRQQRAWYEDAMSSGSPSPMEVETMRKLSI